MELSPFRKGNASISEVALLMGLVARPMLSGWQLLGSHPLTPYGLKLGPGKAANGLNYEQCGWW